MSSSAHDASAIDHLRCASDLLHLLFVFDEYTDVASPAEARKQADIVMDALRNPHLERPKGEWLGGEMMKQ